MTTRFCPSGPLARSQPPLGLIRRRFPTMGSGWILEPKSQPRFRSPESAMLQRTLATSSESTTRAAMAATSRDVKTKLVRLLFPEGHQHRASANRRTRDPPEASNYSYQDLRRAYLQRLQVIHPDKLRASGSIGVHGTTETNDGENLPGENGSVPDTTHEFRELQSTWDRYEELSKSMARVIRGDGATASFTRFGVGCSFSDNEEERALRTEITDQACRGWFSSGLVAAGCTDEPPQPQQASSECSPPQNSLLDDSMFVPTDACHPTKDAFGSPDGGTKATKSRGLKRTLIPGMN